MRSDASGASRCGDVEQIPPRHVLDHQVEKPIGVFPPIEDGNNAGVADAAGGAGFQTKARHGLGVVRVAGIQDLDGHFPIQRNLSRPVYPSDRPLTDDRPNHVLAVEYASGERVLVHVPQEEQLTGQGDRKIGHQPRGFPIKSRLPKGLLCRKEGLPPVRVAVVCSARMMRWVSGTCGAPSGP